MRNLKRALSLALAAVMLIGMMVVGASAVSYNDFTDRDEIVNKDAVSMLTTLGVIDGKTDGSYDPEGTVRRDEMAKMISVIMNQGVDNNELYSGVDSKLTDIGDNWAKGHINYCFTLGIIAGRGDGRFDPAANVTGAEAAKMLLVAAGYDPAIEGFVGTDWAINTNAKASSLGIFRNFNKNIMNPLSRDDAALLIYNALDVEMIQKYENGYAIGYTDHRTILSAMYGVYKVEGVVVANEWAELDQTDSDAALKAGKTTLDNVVLYSSTTANTTTGEGVAQSGQIAFNVSTGVETLGKTVTLYIEKTTILSDSKVLGVSLKDDVNVIEATDATKNTLKGFLKGTGLTTTSDTEYYVNYGFCKSEDAAEAIINNYVKGASGEKFNLNGISVEVIDNNNDGDVDYVLYRQETLSKVSSYSEKNEVIGFTAPTYKNGALDSTKTVKLDFDDVVFAEDVTTDDLILYVQYGGRTYISVPEIVTGTMTRVDRDKDDELYITVEGETYKQSYILDTASLVDVDIEHFDINSFREFSTLYDFILDSTGKYVVAVRPAEETVTNYALVIGSAWTQNALDVKGQVKILKTDGTEGTYYINWTNSAKAFDVNGKATTAAKKALEAYLGTRDVNDTVDEGYAAINAAVGSVITYTLSDDDMLTIKKVMRQNTVDGSNAITAVSPVTAGVTDVVMAPATKLQDTLGAKYDAGDGYVTTNNQKTYAIDKNTIAFYYKDSDNYGVAIGWDHMGDVANGTALQIWPVVAKNAAGGYDVKKLAEVVLFAEAPTTSTANWLFVLSANAISSKVLELNVVFEDGTTKAIEVSKEDYGDDFNDPSDFLTAYKYGVNSDGTYTLNIGSKRTAEAATLLRDGTLDVDGTLVNSSADGIYPTLTGKTNIWDVTDMSDASDGDAPKGSFILNERKNAIIIYNSETAADVRTVVTAWVWDEDESADPETPVYGYNKVTEYATGELLVQHYAESLTARQVGTMVREFLKDSTIESVVYNPSTDKATVTYNDKTSVEYGITLDRVYAVTLKITDNNAAKDGKVTINGVDYTKSSQVIYVGAKSPVDGLPSTGSITGTGTATFTDVDTATGITESTGTLTFTGIKGDGTITVDFAA